MSYRDIQVHETRSFTYLLQQNWPSGARFEGTVENGTAILVIWTADGRKWTGEGRDMRTAEWEAWKAYERG